MWTTVATRVFEPLSIGSGVCWSKPSWSVGLGYERTRSPTAPLTSSKFIMPLINAFPDKSLWGAFPMVPLEAACSRFSSAVRGQDSNVSPILPTGQPTVLISFALKGLLFLPWYFYPFLLPFLWPAIWVLRFWAVPTFKVFSNPAS